MADKLHRLSQWYAFGIAQKAAQEKEPTRIGTAYVARRVDGAYLLETRPDSGLLGGMQAWPTTDWSEKAVEEDAPIHAEWKTQQARCATPLPISI